MFHGEPLQGVESRDDSLANSFKLSQYDSLVPALQSGIANITFPNYAANKSPVLRKT